MSERKNFHDGSRRARVISGFPGIGKSTFKEKAAGIVVIDCDSLDFGWADAKNRVRHPDWPNNYIRYIIEQMGKADVVLVSSHQEVRDALVREGIRFYLIYPTPEQKDEYLKRYRKRGESEVYIDMLERNFVPWIGSMMRQEHCDHIALLPGEYLPAVADRIF